MKIKGLPQALGVTIYCLAIGFLIFNANSVFGKTPNFFGPVAFLLLFSVSAMICVLIVFYEPYKLFFGKKQKEALDLVIRITLWLFVSFIAFILAAIIFK